MAIATEHIAQETATGKATIATLNREREGLIQRQIELRQQLERDSRSLKQVEQDISQTTITATAEGTIVRLNLRNPGQTVRSGETLAQIVPSHVPWVVKAAVSSQDIGKLNLGQTAQMRVSACPYSDYGTLKGVVSQISQDTIRREDEGGTAVSTNPIPTHQETAFYEVTIKPERLVLGKENHSCPIQLGMEGRADIRSREETVLQFLLRTVRLMTDW
jgi:multidrug efflux pump subunit AcrA (membrane-fusion protein)